eukprot:CAMPEP_0170296534 /NCGR_PEP_ID=MMETSP0116_2-20130129/48415_1 /TAXON_ID=400756 /ORGANISM="Durinskia baltica, Strain CSIRO CS-38" /LENGTH=78 /DNA_ID=CAMNT_0010548133 /DNA_START=113 /DNA_END=345 /DNA_ORIENTATION=-
MPVPGSYSSTVPSSFRAWCATSLLISMNLAMLTMYIGKNMGTFSDTDLPMSHWMSILCTLRRCCCKPSSVAAADDVCL